MIDKLNIEYEEIDIFDANIGDLLIGVGSEIGIVTKIGYTWLHEHKYIRVDWHNRLYSYLVSHTNAKKVVRILIK